MYGQELVSHHPLSPLDPNEISKCAQLISAAWPKNTELTFKNITLAEPPKRILVPYLEKEHNGLPREVIDRKAFVTYYIRNTDRFHEAIVNLSSGQVERNARLGPHIHGNLDAEEVLLVEKVVLEDESVKAEIAKLNLPAGTVVCADPWPYGSDGINDSARMYQVLMYMRDPANPNEPDSNHYAFPLPISPVVDCVHFSVIRIDIMPTGREFTSKSVTPYEPVPANEYLPNYQDKLRRDLKPLRVTQPEGSSFTISQSDGAGHSLNWQKWSFRVGFNQREGMVLYDVRYGGRPLFYRVSLSDMNIPYADPRPPFHRKSVFDLGDAGAGAMANNLKLGCDCLGHIQYLSAYIADSSGKPLLLENCICVHEQDAGIGWKHTNYRTGKAAITRSRELVLQSIITVSNYEYILAFIFNQAGEMTYEARATGILSTQPASRDLEKSGVPFGTVVHPGVLAVHHQHIFCLRIDPMIDGHSNRLVYDEALPMPLDPDTNPFGNGYVTSKTIIRKSSGLDLNPDTNRVFKIENTNTLNPINNQNVAYKIQLPPFQKILAHPSSWNFKRSEFSDHNIYVTTHRDNELFAGGWYTPQSRGGSGVRSWAARDDDLTAPDADIVIWAQFGINHITRIEDFPVMPCETLRVNFKPVNFFDKNPALDVPPSEQNFNQSSLAGGQHILGSAAGDASQNDGCCSGTSGRGRAHHL